MGLVAKSDQTTGNQTYCSYVIQTNDVVFAFTAPYSKRIDQSASRVPHPGFNADQVHSFFGKHGLGVRAVGVMVEDAEVSYNAAVENGAVGNLEPVTLIQDGTGGKTKLAELHLYGDVVLRLVSNHGFAGPYLPNFEPVDSLPISYGIRKLDYILGNVSSVKDAAEYIGGFTGFRKLQDYVSNGKLHRESKSQGLLLGSSNHIVSLSLDNSHFDKTSESQVRVSLQQDEIAGVRRVALVCDDIFSTVREMRMRSHIGGFEFVPTPDTDFYKRLVTTFGTILSVQQWNECIELGIVLEKDQRGLNLRVLTQSLADRPTVFIEIMQRIYRSQHRAEGIATGEVYMESKKFNSVDFANIFPES